MSESQDKEQNHAIDAGFGSKIRSALFWRSGSQIVSQFVTWGVTLAVIRILDPADYGLFAMTQVILVFMNFMNGYGLISALIQSETLDRHELRQAFGLLLLLNGALACLQLAIAPFAADYYGQPMVASLLRVQALLYIATPFIALPEVVMGRDLDFRRPAIVNLIAAMVSAATALGFALAGAGVWTLVAAPIALFWVRGIGFTLATRLFVRPSFDFRGAGHMVRFGGALLGSNLFWIVQTQSDVFIAGRLLDPHSIGLYAEALFLTQIFASKFVPPLNEVAFPAYARMQKDRAAMAWSFTKAVRLIMLIAAPLYCGLAVTAGPVVALLFGPKWSAMVPFVAILALAMPFMTLQILFAPALNAIGRPGITARTALCGAILMPSAFLIGIQFGAIGLAWAWAIAFPLLTLVTIVLAAGPIGLSYAALGRALLPGWGCAALMGLSVLGLRAILPPLPVVPQIAVLVAGGIAFYALFLMLFARETIGEVIRLVVRRKLAA